MLGALAMVLLLSRPQTQILFLFLTLFQLPHTSLHPKLFFFTSYHQFLLAVSYSTTPIMLERAQALVANLPSPNHASKSLFWATTNYFSHENYSPFTNGMEFYFYMILNGS